MKSKLIKIGKYLLQIVLTAIASALIAMLQNYIATHQGLSQDTIDISKTTGIGTTLASAKIAYTHFKNNLF